DESALAERVDRFLAERWTAPGIRSGERSSDSVFLRRVYLDLTGKIPPVAVVRHFLADQTANKRELLIDRLLQSPTHSAFFARQWRQLLAPNAENDPGKQAALAALDAWLRQQFTVNVPYDRWVRELLTFSPDGRPDADPATPSPRLFYLGRED